jgi:hypothetical protein
MLRLLDALGCGCCCTGGAHGSEAAHLLTDVTDDLLDAPAASDDINGDGLSAVRAHWPHKLYGPPPNAAEILDPDGPWGATSCGVEVRECKDQPSKGMGVFAIRPMRRGDIVGIYHGEVLTEREWLVRHASTRADQVLLKTLSKGPLASVLDRATREERRARLESLPARLRPCGGVDNHGAYCFYVAPKEPDGPPVYIDAEDSSRSSWCRFINHAPSDAANVQPRVEAESRLIWFVATRDVERAAELRFDYGPAYDWNEPPV